MMVGKTGHGPACKQERDQRADDQACQGGKRVVRLKGGDPMIFGRAGEEIAACRAANIPVEVVPGISAAQGAASRLLVSLTHRAQARRLQYVTGHDRDGKLPADIDWRALADPAATTIVYMPKKTLRELSARAIAAGARSRQRPRSRSRMRRGRMRRSSPARSRILRTGSKPMHRTDRCS